VSPTMWEQGADLRRKRQIAYVVAMLRELPMWKMLLFLGFVEVLYWLSRAEEWGLSRSGV